MDLILNPCGASRNTEAKIVWFGITDGPHMEVLALSHFRPTAL